jgi:hypothetical protein
MRALTLNLYSNQGTSAAGSLKVISDQLIELADVTQEVDSTGNLSKITPGTLTAKVGDPDGSIWNFIQNSIALPLTTAGAAQGVLPPWLELYAGGTRMFLGAVDMAALKNIQRAEDYSIEFKVNDWSMGLASTYLGAPTSLTWEPDTVYAVNTKVLNGANTYICTTAGTSATSGGPIGVGSYQDGTAVWAYVTPEWQRPAPLTAVNGTAVSQAGFSGNFYAPAQIGTGPGSLWYGQNLNVIFFADPCGWVYSGATISTDYPVFRVTFPTGPITTPDVRIGSYGGTLTETSYNAMTSQIVYTWTPPTGVTGLFLPNAQFPAGTIVASTTDGVEYQVGGLAGTKANTWITPPYNTSLAPGAGSFWTVVSTEDQQAQCMDSDRAVTSYLAAWTTASPWPAVGPTTNYKYGPAPGNWETNVSLVDATSSDLDYWVVTVAIASGASDCYTLNLNSVNGIVMGDVLTTVDVDSPASMTVASVDPILLQIRTIEAISNIALGAHVYWDSDTKLDLVREDPRTLLTRACSPYSVDTTQFVEPATDRPMFSFLPLRGPGGALYAVGDLDITPGGLLRPQTGAYWLNPVTDAWQPSYAWTGTPDTGWSNPTETAPATPMAEWTCQLVNAPSSLMPYEVQSLNPWQRLRNRCYCDTTYRRENNGLIYLATTGGNFFVPGAYVSTQAGTSYNYTVTIGGVNYASTNSNDNFTPWSNTWAAQAGALVVYDYVSIRRLIFNGTSGGSPGAVQLCPWSGSAWGSASNYSWPSSVSGSSSYAQSAVPMIGLAGAALAYMVTPSGSASPTASGSTLTTSADRLELWGFSGGLLASLDLSNHTALLGGTLVTTPYGVYLVGASAIAQVAYSGGALVLTTAYLTDAVSWLFANTLVARTSGELVIMGRLDTGTGTGTVTTTTWLFRLQAPLANSLDGSVIFSEQISTGSPATAAAVRDPSKPGRIVGHIGGSMWQLDTVRPFCIARCRPSGMTAMELIEHVCQAFDALAVPDANGIMHIVSRVNTTAAIDLEVNRVSVATTACWAEFSSIVRVTATSDDSTYYDSFGQQGGIKTEVDNHPLCYSMSDCSAMADAWCDWLGVPRFETEEEWIYTDPSTAAPWEAIPLFTKVCVSGGKAAHLMSLSQSLVKGTATVKTLEA